MISKETVDKIYDEIRVEEVIGDFVTLKKSGSNLKGLSPFSQEKTPSFMVSPSKQIWKDFSSGKGGGAVNFLMEHEHYTYPEALRYLANKYNIEIVETAQNEEQKAAQSERETLYLVNEYAQKYFNENLWKNEQGKAVGLSYLKERGFTKETIKKFQIGYNLDTWTDFTNTAISKGYLLENLVKTGLTKVKENSNKFDFFKGRVIFPIHSMSGRVLGFGGRTLKNEKNIAKYLNSPESVIYHKTDILYGIYFAKQAISREDNCYLVEGYTDMIALYQAGIENVVASAGTALTEKQISIVKRLTSNITIVFDGDVAGMKAAMRGVDMILSADMNVKIITLPEGEDPDSFSKTHHKTELKTFFEKNNQDFIKFKTKLLLKNANDPISKSNVVNDIVESIHCIENEIKRELYVKSCAELLDLSEEVLFNYLAQKQLAKQIETTKKTRQTTLEIQQKPPEINKIGTNLDLCELEIVKILLLYGEKKITFEDLIYSEDAEQPQKIVYQRIIWEEIFLNLQEDETVFNNVLFREIYDTIITQIQKTEKIEQQYFTQHSNAKIASTCVDILMPRYKVDEGWKRKNIFVPPDDDDPILQKKVTDATLGIRKILVDKKIESLKNQLKDTEENLVEVKKDIKNWTKLKQRILKRLKRQECIINLKKK